VFFIKKSRDGLWLKCVSCSEIVYKNQLAENFYVCPKCDNYFKINCDEYVKMLAEPGSFQELFGDIRSTDPLGFKDIKKYAKRLKELHKKLKINEAIKCGFAGMGAHKLCMGVLDFSFMGGSMGSAVGEKITLLVEKAIQMKLPVLIISTSGGARMQEGIFSLMQMAKTAGALQKLSESALPYISVLTNPTTGGVSASFAFLGDVIICEPRALVGFAGPRVIEQTIRQKLPGGFQRAEFLLEKGQIDMIVERRNLKKTIIRILDMFGN